MAKAFLTEYPPVLNSTSMTDQPKTSLLLADDSPTIAKILGMALASEPLAIRSVLTAEAAMTELQVDPPYFFLIDLMLPEINGYEFTRLIRSDPKLASTKVVLLSSAFDPIDDAEFQACGADAVIAKPFDPSELRELLHKLQGLPPPRTRREEGDYEENSGSLDPSALLGSSNEESSYGGDADSILAGLTSGNEEEAAAPGVMPEGLEAFDLSSLGLSALPEGEERPEQGCLDGKFAQATDVHYPQAHGAYGQYSYFKPREAYQLKKQIEREKMELKAYFEDSFDVAKTNAHFQAAAATTACS
ncbi:MAG: response regulator, partial [Proteobacteria bacterium]